MRAARLSTALIGFGLLFAVPTLIGLVLRMAYPELPNFAYPLFGSILGLPIGFAIVLLWFRALDKASDGRRRTQIERATLVFILVTFGSVVALARGVWQFERLEPAASTEVPVVAKVGATTVQGPMTRSERELHSRAVHSVEAGAADWVKRLEESGSHGPVGTVPYFLDARIKGDTVRIRNLGAERIRLAISRLSTGQASGNEPCAYRSRKGPEYIEIASGQTMDYLPASGCINPAGSLEFRVGEPTLNDPVGWWTDSALARWREEHPELLEHR